jgi:choline kinase
MHGEPLVAWHLKLLRDVEDVVVVVGYQAAAVIEAVSSIRRDVTFAFNHNYMTTGTAASLAIGAHGAPGDVISLDGDLLIHPEDFDRVLRSEEPCVGVAAPSSADAVYATVTQAGDGDLAVTSFNRTGEGLEWTGLLRAPTSVIAGARAGANGRGHVYEMLAPHLPIRAHSVRAREIDTPDDYDQASAWLEPIAHLWTAPTTVS